MAYSAGTMPLGSCNLVLYCCAQLNYGYSPLQEAGDVGNFERLWNVTASIRPWQRPMLIIGDSGDNELGRFRDILRYRHAKETFVAATANWCLRQGYAGVFLQWPHGPRFALDHVVPVMVELQQLFLARSLTLGTVLPQDEIEANWTHLHELATALGEASIVLKPPVYTSRHFTHWTFRLATLSHDTNNHVGAGFVNSLSGTHYCLKGCKRVQSCQASPLRNIKTA
ncbi:hypothetical protein HPB48_018792 [Haemaphysalis longicornis]|uniref:Uncharacterized protein n=1 Tax=Haemaphysalis longicornis TaxID=44386 RepID=A0A9J6G474_HAELO|nr:hypothetical protein HPB48_018792 [Haemaphysalis longicornis]